MKPSANAARRGRGTHPYRARPPDSAGHAINVILVQAGAARLLNKQDPERAQAALETIEEVARETLGEIDQLVGALREDDHPEETGGTVEPPLGLAALETLAERHRSAGLAVSVRTRGSQRPLPPGLDEAAYRILQEALTNAPGTGGEPPRSSSASARARSSSP